MVRGRGIRHRCRTSDDHLAAGISVPSLPSVCFCTPPPPPFTPRLSLVPPLSPLSGSVSPHLLGTPPPPPSQATHPQHLQEIILRHNAAAPQMPSSAAAISAARECQSWERRPSFPVLLHPPLPLALSPFPRSPADTPPPPPSRPRPQCRACPRNYTPAQSGCAQCPAARPQSQLSGSCFE
jgi:hypothetical protein